MWSVPIFKCPPTSQLVKHFQNAGIRSEASPRQGQRRLVPHLFERKAAAYFFKAGNWRELLQDKALQRGHVGHADQEIAVASLR
jgi:hypothetical protein